MIVVKKIIGRLEFFSVIYFMKPENDKKVF